MRGSAPADVFVDANVLCSKTLLDWLGHVRDYEIDGSYRGADKHDAHVHAAAVACRAD